MGGVRLWLVGGVVDCHTIPYSYTLIGGGVNEVDFREYPPVNFVVRWALHVE